MIEPATDDITSLSASDLAEAIRRGDYSCASAVEAYLERIEKHNPELNAIVTLDAEGARRRAKQIDERLGRGERLGALGGVPVTVKDAYETEEMRTTFGHRLKRNNVPTRDATVVERVKNAGAVVLGKTNIPELSWDWQTKSPIFGRTNNPHNTDYTPGGSGGGGAAAVAANLCALDIGADAAGSIRVPAHFCGVYGLMPTAHTVSGAGHMELEDAPQTRSDLSSFGALARSVADLRLTLSVIAGTDNRHYDVVPAGFENQSHDAARFEDARRANATTTSKPFADYRFAWTDDFAGVPITRETQAALQALVAKLQAAGCTVERAAPPDFDLSEALETSGEMWGYEAGAHANLLLRTLLRAVYVPMFGRGLWSRGFVRGLKWNALSYGRARERRGRLTLALEKFLSGWDAWLCPVTASPAFTHRRTGARIEVDGKRIGYTAANGSYASIFNITGNPVVVIPISKTNEARLPIGVQIVGRRWRDLDLLNAAELIANVAQAMTPTRPAVADD